MKTYTEQYAGVAKGLLNSNAEQFINNALGANSLEPLKAYKHYLKTLTKLESLNDDDLLSFIDDLTATLKQIEVKPTARAGLKGLEYLMLEENKLELLSCI